VDCTATAVHGIEKMLSDTLVPTLEAGPPFSTNDGTPGPATTPIQMTNSESQSMRQIQSMCSQELAKGHRLGFLTEGDDRDQDENIVQINVYNGSTTPFSSPRSPCSTPTPSAPSSSKHHLHLPLPTNPLSYTDGTTSGSEGSRSG
jgi:hypothetical protein